MYCYSQLEVDKFHRQRSWQVFKTSHSVLQEEPKLIRSDYTYIACVCVCVVVAHRHYKGLGKVAFFYVLKINIISFPCVAVSPVNLGSSAGLYKVISCQDSKGEQEATSSCIRCWHSNPRSALASREWGTGHASDDTWADWGFDRAPSASGLCALPTVPLSRQKYSLTLAIKKMPTDSTDFLVLVNRKVIVKKIYLITPPKSKRIYLF